MYLSQWTIVEALKNLESVHPFYGITFLVFKQGRLPVGKSIEFPINHKEEEFLKKHYQPDRTSSYFFRVFRVSDKSKFWLEPDYPSSGSQSTRTRKFERAFIHQRNTSAWGWAKDYVDHLARHLYQGRPIPAFFLATWLYRERAWASGTTAEDILTTFFREFQITEEEQARLFNGNATLDRCSENLFQAQPTRWEDLRTQLNIPPPPDAAAEEGGALSFLRITGVGPAKELTLTPGGRVNLFTGDNGLGKSFLLECIWWVLSGHWASSPALPRRDARKREPRIAWRMAGPTGISISLEAASSYNWEQHDWPVPRGRPTLPGLLLYARVDGGFAVWDPSRPTEAPSPIDKLTEGSPLVFSRDNVWDGLRTNLGDRTRYLCNGLINDWVAWQTTESPAFDTLRRVLHRLSPPDLEKGDLGPLEPGKPVRIPGDSRMIPSVRHAYGEEPLTHASAGVRRIVALSYLIVWAWEEHEAQRQLSRRPPLDKMVILIDEVEAHLHPQWQRRILPALLDIHDDLRSSVGLQLFISTHSPLVMASVEPRFESDKDRIFHFDLKRHTLMDREVVLEDLPFIRHGTVDAWLTSDVFEMRQARTVEAEEAIEEAKRLQMRDDVTQQEVQEVNDRLVRYLAADDKFWPRWSFYAEKHGVNF